MGGPVLAVDVGGTNVRVAVVTPVADIVVHVREPTPVDDATPEAILELVRRVRRSQPTDHAVIGIPGTIDYRGGRVHELPNLPRSWVPGLSSSRLADLLEMEVALANDADLAAVGEAYFGAGRERDDVVYLTISTGIGGGVVLQGRLVRGAWSLAELGHTIVDAAALASGHASTLEELGSGTALEHMAAATGLRRTDGRGVMELVRAGDEAARAVWDRVATAIGIAVVNAAWTFAPRIIVLGGGVGLNGDLVLPRARAMLDAHGPGNLPEPIELAVARLGDDAGLLGAAAWHAATS